METRLSWRDRGADRNDLNQPLLRTRARRDRPDPIPARAAPALARICLKYTPAMNELPRPPSIDRLLRAPSTQAAIVRWGRLAVKRCAIELLAAARQAPVLPAWAVDADALAARITRVLRGRATTLQPVLNLSGTLLHTNLGRAVLPAAAVAAVTVAAGSPVNLEFDLQTGARGKRETEVGRLLCELTGAEAATVVNNNAAALVLVLNSLAKGRTVPVSRGELVEIGGSFRLPAILESSGCTLREVGTTNRTHPRDYAEALAAGDAMILRVHPSNFAIQGFTSTVAASALAELAHAHHVPFVVDLGSGALIDLTAYGLPHESLPQQLLAEGADLVTFSGDKLLGGPQAGLIVGRRDLIERLDSNPLKRALRADKLTLAALAEVLKLYGDPGRLDQELPLLVQLRQPVAGLMARAAALCAALRDAFAPAFTLCACATESEVGSGALPVATLASGALAFDATAVRHKTVELERLATALRQATPPVIGRINEQRLLLDLRTCHDDGVLQGALADADATLRGAKP